MAKKIRVVQVGSSLRLRGGMTNVMELLLNHGWDNACLRLVATHAPGSVIRRCLAFAGGYAHMLWLLLTGQVDVVHIHMSHRGSFYRKYHIHRLVKLFGKPVIVHLHGSEFGAFCHGASAGTRKKIRRLLRTSDAVLALGSAGEALVRQIEPDSRVLIFHNAITIGEQTAHWNGGAMRLVYLGVLIPRKGLVTLLDAIARLAQKGLPVELVIAGSGSQMQELTARCEKLGIAARVRFSDWVSGAVKRNLLLESHCMVLPSANEGLPIAILEALGYGLPVVSTPVGSIADAVRDGCNGYLVQPGDADQLAARIEAVFSDPAHWRRLSEAARTSALADFNAVNYLRRLEKLYEALYRGEEFTQ